MKQPRCILKTRINRLVYPLNTSSRRNYNVFNDRWSLRANSFELPLSPSRQIPAINLPQSAHLTIPCNLIVLKLSSRRLSRNLLSRTRKSVGLGSWCSTGRDMETIGNGTLSRRESVHLN